MDSLTVSKHAVKILAPLAQVASQGHRKVIDFCAAQQVGTLFIGISHGVREGDYGRHHNQRMAQWEYGKDIEYITHKAKQVHIKSFTGSERGASSQCRVCGHRHKPQGRVWNCKRCGFRGHRDLVGSVNMHPLAYGEKVIFPRIVTYLRPGLTRRSSRAGTPQRCLRESMGQPPLLKRGSRQGQATPEKSLRNLSL
jgi:putative transposase